ERCGNGVERAARDECVLVDARNAFGGAHLRQGLEGSGGVYEIGQRQVAGRGVAAEELGKPVGREGLLDGANAVDELGVAHGRLVAFEVPLADEQGGHVRDSLTAQWCLVKQRHMAEPAPYRQDMNEFAAILRAGGIVAFPTETVYGLGADATKSDAVLK